MQKIFLNQMKSKLMNMIREIITTTNTLPIFIQNKGIVF